MTQIQVPVVRNILQANERLAAGNRKRFEENGIFTINLMSSPGAGKTSLLEKTIEGMTGRIRMAVIEGDLQSSYDAERIQRKGVQAVQINTDGGCHLDGNMIQIAMDSLDLANIDLLVIENVGNLVCPAEFNLGEHEKVMILSVAEGDDKPLKYPPHVSAFIGSAREQNRSFALCGLRSFHDSGAGAATERRPGDL